MKITITLKALDNETLKNSLNYLSKQSIHDNLEIIIIDESYDDISENVILFEDEFDRITIENNPNIEFYNQILVNARGEYLLFTTSNNLSAEKSYRDEKFLENIYIKASENCCDITIFNKINYHEYETSYDYSFIDSIVEKPVKCEDISQNNLITLATLDCDILFSNNFRVNPTRFSKSSLKNPEEFFIENIANSNKILILNNYSNHRKYLKTINSFKEKNDTISLSDLKKIYEDAKNINIKDLEDVQKIVSKEFNSKISIIIPVYNPLSNDIIKIINSLFRQNFKFNNLEVIFVNDASTFTDGIELTKKYCDIYHNIDLLELTEHVGYSCSCNVGLDNANSKYIMLLDQKKYYVDNAIETLYNIISSENADIVSGNHINHGLSGKCVNWNKYGLTDYETIINTNYLKTIILDMPTIIESKIYKKSFLNENNIRMNEFNVDSKKIFDYETILQEECYIIYVNKSTVVCEKEENPYYDLKNKSLYTLQDLLKFYDSRYYLYDLCQKNLPEASYTVLNTLNYVTYDILLKTPLTYDEFKEVVDYSYNLYCDYLSNNKVERKEKIEKIAKYITEKNYSATNNVYKRFIRIPKLEFTDYVYDMKKKLNS